MAESEREQKNLERTLSLRKFCLLFIYRSFMRKLQRFMQHLGFLFCHKETRHGNIYFLLFCFSVHVHCCVVLTSGGYLSRSKARPTPDWATRHPPWAMSHPPLGYATPSPELRRNPHWTTTHPPLSYPHSDLIMCRTLTKLRRALPLSYAAPWKSWSKKVFEKRYIGYLATVSSVLILCTM
jgi:hypothetical protein